MIDFKDTVFFLGGNTPKGFYAFLTELYNPFDKWRMYIIKGGPGTGKSYFMKKIARELESLGVSVERILCASDPKSLDAIICHELKLTIADGTPHHVLEPRFPGVVEQILNFGDFWDETLLREKGMDIRSAALMNSEEHKNCARILKAAGALEEESRRLTEDIVLKDKVKRFSQRLAAREFVRKKGVPSREYLRFLSAITPEGITFLHETVNTLCSRVIAINDPLRAVSPLLMAHLRESALMHGLDIISCPCPMDPEGGLEHLLIPEIGLGFVTVNPYHPLPQKPQRTIHCERFISEEKMKSVHGRLVLNAKVKTELIEEAVSHLKSAKECHDILESFYIDAMNFGELKNFAERTLEKIKMEQNLI